MQATLQTQVVRAVQLKRKATEQTTTKQRVKLV